MSENTNPAQPTFKLDPTPGITKSVTVVLGGALVLLAPISVNGAEVTNCVFSARSPKPAVTVTGRILNPNCDTALPVSATRAKDGDLLVFALQTTSSRRGITVGLLACVVDGVPHEQIVESLCNQRVIPPSVTVPFRTAFQVSLF